jgi:hypothetical protein
MQEKSPVNTGQGRDASRKYASAVISFPLYKAVSQRLVLMMFTLSCTTRPLIVIIFMMTWVTCPMPTICGTDSFLIFYTMLYSKAL